MPFLDRFRRKAPPVTVDEAAIVAVLVKARAVSLVQARVLASASIAEITNSPREVSRRNEKEIEMSSQNVCRTFVAGDFADVIKHQNVAGKLRGWTADQLAALGNACEDEAALAWLQGECPAFNSVWYRKLGNDNRALAQKLDAVHWNQGDWTRDFPSVGKIVAYLGGINLKTGLYTPH
jgi:hypothetical protein